MQCCCTWERKYCLTRTEKTFHHQSVFYTKVTSSFLPSQRCAKKQSNIFVHTLHCQQNQYFAKSKILSQKAQCKVFISLSILRRNQSPHIRLTAATQLLQRHSSFLTLYVSRHNCTASFADWNDQFSYSTTCLEQMRCTYCLDRVGEHR